jgi:hypothetical protein
MHSGAPFAKKGGSDLALPKMDIPINLLQWEVFLPSLYQVKDFGGDAIATAQLPPMPQEMASFEDDKALKEAGAWEVHGNVNLDGLLPGQIGGFIVDPQGAVVPNTQVTVAETETGAQFTTMTDQGGRWIASDISSGNLRITANAQGFNQFSTNFLYDASKPLLNSFSLRVGSVNETVEVNGTGNNLNRRELEKIERKAKQQAEQVDNAASANVVNLQKRIAGVLPVRVDVPHAGNSYRFVRPLVLNEETKVTFSYKTKG